MTSPDADCEGAEATTRQKEMSWWAPYFSAQEVEEAIDKRKADRTGLLFDELNEYPQLGHGSLLVTGGHRRSCDMADSFDRGRCNARSFNMWLWGLFYSNPHMFPSLNCLVNMVRIKQMLWNRYSFFYDVDVIREVYPDNELADQVAHAYEKHNIALPHYRDKEMSYELRNAFFARTPRKMRSYDEEVRVQRSRLLWRYAEGVFSLDELPYASHLKRSIHDGEELPRCLQEADEAEIRDRAAALKLRHKPLKEQHEAREPDRERWLKKAESLKESQSMSSTTAQDSKGFEEGEIEEFLLDF